MINVIKSNPKRKRKTTIIFYSKKNEREEALKKIPPNQKIKFDVPPEKYFKGMIISQNH